MWSLRLVVLGLLWLGVSGAPCINKAVVLNFGDSNSDTGGYAVLKGVQSPENGRLFFDRPTGRLCDGRLIVDFLCFGGNPGVPCFSSPSSVCRLGSRRVFWDAVHYTEAANAIVASQIASTHFSTPPLPITFFCN